MWLNYFVLVANAAITGRRFLCSFETHLDAFHTLGSDPQSPRHCQTLADVRSAVAPICKLTPATLSSMSGQDKPTVVVVGAGSKQGSSVVCSLLQAGAFTVKAMTKGPDDPSAQSLPALACANHPCQHFL